MKQHNIIQKKYYFFRSVLGVIKNDLEGKETIELLNRLKMWRLGFTSEKYRIYGLNANCHENYISDRNWSATRFINQPYDVILEDKIIFEKIFSQYVTVPKNYSFIDKGTILPLQSEVRIDSIESVIKVCNEKDGLVIKPVGGAQGKGVVILKVRNDEIFMNNKKQGKKQLENHLKKLDNYIITEYIKQGEYSNTLYQGSTNTMRIMAMVDPETHKPFIAGAAQRIGGKTSGGLDNFAAGGYSANIDVDSGILSTAASRFGSKKLVWYDRHPDSNALIKGVQVPMWDEIKETLTNIMEEMPYLKYVGWDVVLTNNDIVIIEGNNHPNPRSVQIHKPLLADLKVKKFYEHYGIV